MLLRLNEFTAVTNLRCKGGYIGPLIGNAFGSPVQVVRIFFFKAAARSEEGRTEIRLRIASATSASVP